MRTLIIICISYWVLTPYSVSGQSISNHIIINKNGSSIAERFTPPEGFTRCRIPTQSFQEYLRNLPLKAHGEKVHYFDGSLKNPGNIYMAVIDMEISNRDLQQCADAVMRLKGEYHFQKNEFAQIHFNFLSDGEARYFIDYAGSDHSYQTFLKYMDYIFAFANTASLYHEMEKVSSIQNMQIGDVFIQKGTPYGHAVIVVDMAVNTTNGEKVFILAQSYMPAQEIQILINPQAPTLSPWYTLKPGTLITPEWRFTDKDLRRFPEH